jgi:bifunctional DNA-binding transcriptional regulator/antitoxin component of YhaV-PrlF toxin-antitoxin module
MMREVKQTQRHGRPRRDRTRISSKNQVTLPLDALAAAGLATGDTLRVAAEGPGRLVLTREPDAVTTFAGRLSGVYGPAYLDELRDEWA